MAKSRIQPNKDCCYRCNIPKFYVTLEEHHIFNGPLRSKAEEDGLKIYLCHECHEEVHRNIGLRTKLKQLGQEVFEKEIGTREDFMKRYHKNYL